MAGLFSMVWSKPMATRVHIRRPLPSASPSPPRRLHHPSFATKIAEQAKRDADLAAKLGEADLAAHTQRVQEREIQAIADAEHAAREAEAAAQAAGDAAAARKVTTYPPTTAQVSSRRDPCHTVIPPPPHTSHREVNCN